MTRASSKQAPLQFQKLPVQCLHRQSGTKEIIKLISVRGIVLHLCRACATTLAMEVEVNQFKLHPIGPPTLLPAASSSAALPTKAYSVLTIVYPTDSPPPVDTPH